MIWDFIKIIKLEQRLDEALSKETSDSWIKWITKQIIIEERFKNKQMNNIELDKLVRVSTYARSINRSIELVRIWIRTGKFKENEDYIRIDGLIFIILKD